jgi:hypothetical protein
MIQGLKTAPLWTICQYMGDIFKFEFQEFLKQKQRDPTLDLQNVGFFCDAPPNTEDGLINLRTRWDKMWRAGRILPHNADEIRAAAISYTPSLRGLEIYSELLPLNDHAEDESQTRHFGEGSGGNGAGPSIPLAHRAILPNVVHPGIGERVALERDGSRNEIWASNMPMGVGRSDMVAVRRMPR